MQDKRKIGALWGGQEVVEMGLDMILVARHRLLVRQGGATSASMVRWVLGKSGGFVVSCVLGSPHLLGRTLGLFSTGGLRRPDPPEGRPLGSLIN